MLVAFNECGMRIGKRTTTRSRLDSLEVELYPPKQRQPDLRATGGKVRGLEMGHRDDLPISTARADTRPLEDQITAADTTAAIVTQRK